MLTLQAATIGVASAVAGRLAIVVRGAGGAVECVKVGTIFVWWTIPPKPWVNDQNSKGENEAHVGRRR